MTADALDRGNTDVVVRVDDHTNPKRPRILIAKRGWYGAGGDALAATAIEWYQPPIDKNGELNLYVGVASMPGLSWFAVYPVAMMIGLLGWVARRRVAVLVAALVIAVVLQVLLRTIENDHAWQLSLAVGILTPLALGVWSVVCARSFHPAKLVARPEVPAFDVPSHPGVVLAVAGFTFLAAMMLSGLVRDVAADPDLWFVVGPAMFFHAGLLAAFWWSAMGRFGVRLSPDGIVDRQVFGSLFVPWDALTIPGSAYPHDAQQVTLYLAHPELVRRRGLRFGRPTLLPAAGVDAELLARAIHEYANHADSRSAIGTEAELERFQALPQIIDLTRRARP